MDSRQCFMPLLRARRLQVLQRWRWRRRRRSQRIQVLQLRFHTLRLRIPLRLKSQRRFRSPFSPKSEVVTSRLQSPTPPPMLKACPNEPRIHRRPSRSDARESGLIQGPPESRASQRTRKSVSGRRPIQHLQVHQFAVDCLRSSRPSPSHVHPRTNEEKFNKKK
jgi:hypothetical protein